MRKLLSPTLATMAAALVGLTACSTDSSPTAVAWPASARFAIGDPTTSTPELGKLTVCKSSSSNVSGTFTITRTAAGTGTDIGSALTSVTVAPGVCVIVAEDLGISGNGSDVAVLETSTGFVSASATLINVVGSTPTIAPPTTFNNGGKFIVNSFHGVTITFVNTVVIPPPPICDFVTFGRLVTSVRGQKVVISGNAGGNQPGGGILGEFHIDVDGTDYHVSDIDSYGPITSGALSLLTNSRIVKGIAKNGVAVELRLWDGGEPGKDTDKVYVKIGGVEYLGAGGQFIDQGNMQYHANCRGPG